MDDPEPAASNPHVGDGNACMRYDTYVYARYVRCTYIRMKLPYIRKVQRYRHWMGLYGLISANLDKGVDMQ
jgi:hypothetical protein